jgi:hypothetical protein
MMDMKCEEAKRIMREEETFCSTHLVLSVFLFFVCVSMSKAVDYSPISYWSFDEGSGTTVHDYKGTNHGRIENETAVTWVEGHVGEHALSFTGTGGYVLRTNRGQDLFTRDLELMEGKVVR